MSNGLLPGSSGNGVRGPQHLFGYCGNGGNPAARAHAATMSLGPSFVQISPQRDTDAERLTAFGLVTDETVSISQTHTSDGSFLMIDGRLLEPRTLLEDVLRAWLAEGTSAFATHRFHGFIAAWNASTSECTLIRDPYGISPGYVSATEHGIVFSTDLSTLVKFGVDRTPDPVALDAFIATGYFPAPLTPLKSISKIPPGHIITVTADGVTPSQSWFQHKELDPINAGDAVELMEIGLRRSLERSWPNEGEVGLMLSGGVDSALLLAGVVRMLDRPIRTFTFRYENYSGELNEGVNARAIADHLGVAHEEIPIHPMDVIDDIESSVAAHDEPFTWGLHSYQLGPVAARGITTLYSGAGPDGWGMSRRHRAAVKFSRLPNFVRGPARVLVKAARPLNLRGQTQAEWLTERVSGIGGLYSPDAGWSRAVRRRLYLDPTLVDKGVERLQDIFQVAADEQTTSTTERALILLDKRFNTADTVLLWNRRWTLANGLSLALPYFDHDLVDLALNIEGDTTGKDLLRRISSKYLPSEMAYAPKIPQKIPVGAWIRDSLGDPIRDRLADMPEALTAILDPSRVIQLVDEHVEGSADHGWRIIALLTATVWFDQHWP